GLWQAAAPPATINRGTRKSQDWVGPLRRPTQSIKASCKKRCCMKPAEVTMATSPLTPAQQYFLTAAIDLSRVSLSQGYGPFGAVVVRQGQIIGQAHNEVTRGSDPTAHAEMLAIRRACAAIGHFQLTGCDLYTSCEPCPMCLGAIYWSRLDRVYYANTQQDAAQVGFDDQLIYREIDKAPIDRAIPMIAVPDPAALQVFQDWGSLTDKIEY
ncbi:MAG: nucleoside deaminase, partial [Prochlorothrix sp.]